MGRCFHSHHDWGCHAGTREGRRRFPRRAGASQQEANRSTSSSQLTRLHFANSRQCQVLRIKTQAPAIFRISRDLAIFILAAVRSNRSRPLSKTATHDDDRETLTRGTLSITVCGETSCIDAPYMDINWTKLGNLDLGDVASSGEGPWIRVYASSFGSEARHVVDSDSLDSPHAWQHPRGVRIPARFGG